MTSVARVLPCLIIPSVLLALSAGNLSAQEAAPATADVAAPATVEAPKVVEVPPTDAALTQSVEDFWHYAIVGRYDVAVGEGQKILAYAGEPADDGKSVIVMRAFEAVALAHQDQMAERLLTWQRVDALKDLSVKLLNVVTQGQRVIAGDPKFILSNIDRLGVNQRAYILALARLRDSGEVAVPFMIGYLQDPQKANLHRPIQQALVDLGRLSLNPLLAATEMKDAATLSIVIQVLGDIGYKDAVPYLLKLYANKDTAAPIKAAVVAALARLEAGNPQNLAAAQLFEDVAEKLYYDSAGIRADSKASVAYVWSWDQAKGLVKKDVPRGIFNEVMAMRACRYALEIDAKREAVVSLFLAANFKREAELPAGAADTTQPENAADAHTWGVRFGARYLGPVLSRALRDGNSAVAYRSLRSMGEVVGKANLLKSDAAQPVFQALASPDRLVRFEAAFVVASALPQETFVGSDRVIAILSEALAQTGKSGVVVLGQAGKVAGLVDSLNKTGAIVAKGDAKAVAAINIANSMAAVDAVIIDEQVEQAEIDQLLKLMGASPRLVRVPRVIIANPASPWNAQAARDPLLTVTQVQDGAAIAPVLDDARRKAGTLALDEKVATEYSLRAAELLEKLAVNQNTILKAADAQSHLLTALDDARGDIVKAASAVLGMVDSHDVQSGLLNKGCDDKGQPDVRVALFKGLARNGKTFGNHLNAAEIDVLRKAAVESQDAKIRAAASEAYGALNLPVEQVKPLIFEGK